MVNYGVVWEVFQWTIPPGEPAPAELITGGCSEISSGNSNSVPEDEWEGQPPFKRRGKSASWG